MNAYSKPMTAWTIAVVLLIALAALVSVGRAAPESGDYVVTRLDDPTPGACAPGDCSLREALNAAGGGSGQVVTFAVTGTVELAQPELRIYGTTLLQGTGPENIVIDGNGLGPVFFVVENPPNPAPNCSPTLSGVTVTGGNNANAGGGISVESDCSLTLTDSVVHNNNSSDMGGGIAGGGSDPRGITIRNSAVISNTAPDGGGIFLLGNGLLENVTLSGNSATGTGGGLAVGPFEPAEETSTITLRSVTVANNSAAVGDGVALIEAIPPQNTQVTLHNSIITEAGTSACATVGFDTLTLSSMGFNLATDQSCNLTQPTDLEDTDPHLPVLQNDSGTYVHIPTLVSPALDSGAAGALTTDQRGQPRPTDLPGIPNAADGADRGAYEHQTTPPTAVTLSRFGPQAHDGALPAVLLAGVAFCAGLIILRRRRARG